MGDQVAWYVGLNWLAALLYLCATVANVSGIIFKKERVEQLSYLPVWLGMAVHSAAILYWWRIVGHGPYLAPSEVLSSNAWCSLAMYFVFRRFFPRIRPASMVVFPMVFLTIGLANMYSPAIRSLPPTYGTVWLVLHILIYKISLATLLIALAFSIFYLRKMKGSTASWLQKLPDLEGLDLYAYRFVGFGFIFWGIAMLAGSIWAYKAWGRFWGWDPVETWALVTWLAFGAYLHFRKFFGLQGRNAAWNYMGCFVLSLVAYYVTSHMGSSIHSEYFK